jgi:hypothetical protein
MKAPNFDPQYPTMPRLIVHSYTISLYVPGQSPG